MHVNLLISGNSVPAVGGGKFVRKNPISKVVVTNSCRGQEGGR